MFKAIEVESGQEIILLDSRWAGDLSALRTLGAADKLVCQECRKPVSVRAGEVRRKYFAHKCRADCAYGSESPLLLQARAVLYARLKTQFGEAVTLEKRLKDSEISRPVDCWVTREKGTFAYWVLDGRIRQYEKREQLKRTFQRLAVPVTWIFINTLLEADAEEPERVHLSTTEREFQQTTYLDITLEGMRLQKGETLHYLNPETEEVCTYRSLALAHAPQLYRGRRYSDPLSAIKISPINGELAHPGERERHKALNEEKRALEEQQRQQEARRLQAIEAEAKRAQEQQTVRGNFLTVTHIPVIDRQGQAARPVDRIGVCKFCNTETSEWTAWDGNGMCRCSACYRKGLF